MEHTENENLAIGPLFMVVGILTGVVITSFFVLSGLKNSYEEDLIQGYQEQRTEASIANDAMQAERLDNYDTIDKEKGQYQVPVDRAMELVTEERKDK